MSKAEILEMLPTLGSEERREIFDRLCDLAEPEPTQAHQQLASEALQSGPAKPAAPEDWAGALQRGLKRAVLAILLSLGSLSCVGQSNVYSFELYSCGVGYDLSWVVGSPPYQFGLEGEHYWADSAGRVMQLISVTNSAGEMVLEREAGGVERRHTFVLLGPLHFSVPLPKVAVAVIGCVMVPALVFLAVVVWGRGRNRTKHERAAGGLTPS